MKRCGTDANLGAGHCSPSHEFLRDGDQLAARMTGIIKIDGAATEFESFMFAKVEPGSGKLEWLVERSVWGPAGGAVDHGAN